MSTEGLSHELFQLIFSHIGRSVQLQLLPLAQVLERAKRGQTDGISVTHLDERRITYPAYSKPKQLVNSALAQLYRSAVVLKVYAKWFRHLGKPPASLLAMYGINALPE
jgi:hypothetical protein